jgi:L-aspartate semialdehyde sulfurtransferase ferredoxin
MSTKKYLLYFPQSETEKPIVYNLVKKYNLKINIFRAKVTPEEEGYLVLDISGEDENIHRALSYVEELGVQIDEALKGVRWDPDLCTSCGACLTHCPTRALHWADTPDRAVTFESEKCIECLKCLETCPFGACSSVF